MSGSLFWAEARDDGEADLCVAGLGTEDEGGEASEGKQRGVFRRAVDRRADAEGEGPRGTPRPQPRSGAVAAATPPTPPRRGAEARAEAR